jgi:hypothetical protein
VADQVQEPPRADPANAQYVINLTPEQYESYLKRGPVKPAPARTQIELGGSGTAQVNFKDAADGAVEITAVEWSATGPILVTADKDSPARARLVPSGLGPATVTAVVQTAKGSAQTSIDVMVIHTAGAPVVGTIEITTEPATDAGWVAAQPLVQGSQIMPVPAPAPPLQRVQTVPPAQTMSQPSTQPQPPPESEPAQELEPARD